MNEEREDEKVYWVWLTMVPGIGDHFIHKVTKAGITPLEIYRRFHCYAEENRSSIFHSQTEGDRASAAETAGACIQGSDIFTEKKCQTLHHYAAAEYFDRAQSIVENCRRKQISIFVLTDDEYPERMRSVDDMPAVLYVLGRMELNHFRHTMGIIGARRCTREEKELAVRVSADACREHIPVISGMAKGIDGYAQTAAVENDGYTVAVCGNGPDICYPAEHEKLMEAIVRKGAVVSAYPPGTAPRKYFFPARNRIIAAMSDSLIVIGAGRNSGTQTTVDYFRRLGKQELNCR